MSEIVNKNENKADIDNCDVREREDSIEEKYEYNLQYLANVNRHERDERIVFDEAPHIYYIDGSCEGYISCTTLNHSHFEHFDADAIIKK